MHNATIKSLAADLAARKFSSVELTRHLLSRIRALNPKYNCFITVDDAASLKQAQAADDLRAAGRAGPLTGIPIAQKDIFCAKGWLTTCGSKMLSSFISPYDAHVVEQLNGAGAVNIGKTNMDEFAMGSSSETSFYGPVRNPWNADNVPGGSSGGSAAAVVARLAPGAIGTDTGGSIRQPAALSGICGLKPTYGVVSRYGMIAFASSLDQGGPMARTAEDLAIMMNVMAGFDARDSTSLERAREDYTGEIGKAVKGLKIGLPKEFFAEGAEAGVTGAVAAAISAYRKLGCETVEVSLPSMKLAVPVYYVLAPAEASSNLARYDGVRYGHRAQDYADLTDMYKLTRAQGFGQEVKRRILIGTYVLSHGYYDAYYIQAQKVRRLVARDFAEAFRRCDVIMGPTSPTTAFRLGEKVDDPVKMYLNDIYTIPANLAGLPGMSVPCGFDGSGLPVGLQIVGNYFAEAKMLGIAHQYQQATDWHLRVPPGCEG
ncbi:MAG: aspartyl/glutamyl-tRNA amidotransferase subunit A [Betaproteobacteria bacterium RIFCSPLOWO2_02_FULL_67_26]|nr:MAG: aspartyl/glutamyl-tRNA amidotransferase subunit A [Betaproteobacteria bacterium RIFCSPLOWO2_02_FULL_67_26]